MNTQIPGIPSTVHDDHLIPAQTPLAPTLLERLAADHAAVLAKWNRNFALDLRWPESAAHRS